MSDPKQTELEATAKPKASRRFRILLGVSLALNLLILGVVAGAISNGPRDRGGPPSSRSVSIPYVAAFDGSTKREMRKEMRARLEDRKTALAKDMADYAQFVSVVRADVFDVDLAKSIMEGQLARVGNLQKTGRDIAIEQIESMSPEERNAYADRLEEHLKRKGERRGKKERRDD